MQHTALDWLGKVLSLLQWYRIALITHQLKVWDTPMTMAGQSTVSTISSDSSINCESKLHAAHDRSDAVKVDTADSKKFTIQRGRAVLVHEKLRQQYPPVESNCATSFIGKWVSADSSRSRVRLVDLSLPSTYLCRHL